LTKFGSKLLNEQKDRSFTCKLCSERASNCNTSLFIFVEAKFPIIVSYVDDLILTSDEQLIRSCKEDLAREFEIKDMGIMHYFLGLEVWQGDGELVTNSRKEDATSGEEVDATIYR